MTVSLGLRSGNAQFGINDYGLTLYTGRLWVNIDRAIGTHTLQHNFGRQPTLQCIVSILLTLQLSMEEATSVSWLGALHNITQV